MLQKQCTNLCLFKHCLTHKWFLKSHLWSKSIFSYECICTRKAKKGNNFGKFGVFDPILFFIRFLLFFQWWNISVIEVHKFKKARKYVFFLYIFFFIFFAQSEKCSYYFMVLRCFKITKKWKLVKLSTELVCGRFSLVVAIYICFMLFVCCMQVLCMLYVCYISYPRHTINFGSLPR